MEMQYMNVTRPVWAMRSTYGQICRVSKSYIQKLLRSQHRDLQKLPSLGSGIQRKSNRMSLSNRSEHPQPVWLETPYVEINRENQTQSYVRILSLEQPAHILITRNCPLRPQLSSCLALQLPVILARQGEPQRAYNDEVADEIAERETVAQIPAWSGVRAVELRAQDSTEIADGDC